MEASGDRETAIGLAPGETITKTWHGRHDYQVFRGRIRGGPGAGKSIGELVLTNKRLLFIAEQDGAYMKQVDCSLNALIDVSIQGGGLGFGKYLNVGSGVGNIRLHLDGVDEKSLDGFRAALESASGKSLIPKS
jgi:hypothetical protein